MTLKQQLVEFIQEQLISDGRAARIGDDEALIDRGVIDSMGLLQIMLFIEQQTGIRIPDDEVRLDNFQTVSSIEQLVEPLRSRR